MLPTAATPPDSVRLGHVLRECVSRPVETLVRRWNYKAAITSATARALLFLAVNTSAGASTALAAAGAEFCYRATMSGFYGALTQHLGRVEPARVGWLAAVIGLPLLGHGGELLLHWTRGTPNLGASLAASMCLTALSTSFNLFAMRRGVLVVGAPGRQTLWRDLCALPSVARDFVGVMLAGARRKIAGLGPAAAIAMAVAGSALVVIDRPTVAAQPAPTELGVRLAAFEDPPLTAYRAVRRIEVDNPRFNASAWAEVMTELTPQHGFTWRVLREGGSAMVRRRSIFRVLDAEVASVRSGDPRRARIGDDNYVFGAAVAGDDGTIVVAITPRRRETLPLARRHDTAGARRRPRRDPQRRAGQPRRNGSTPVRSPSPVAIIQVMALAGRHDSRTKPRLLTCRTSHSSRSA
jgi:hypothetical protein